MTHIKVNGTWQPAIVKSKSEGTWVDAIPHTKEDDYWDLKVEIYPSPFDPITNPQSIVHPTFEGTVIPLHSENYYSYKASSTYFDISSTAFKVSIHDGAKYTSNFVYRCGQTKSVSPWKNNAYSVYGPGSTAGEDAFLPWEPSSHVQFNYLGFGANKETKIKIQYTKAAVTSVDIGPYSKNKQYTIGTGADASSFEIFNVAPYDKLYVTVNNDLSTPLMVFANPLSPPVPNGAYYLSAGIFDVSSYNYDLLQDTFLSSFAGDGFRLFPLPNNIISNSTYYLAPGAYMHGRFWVRNVSGIRFMGHGVIDANRESDPSGSWWENWSYDVPGMNDEKKLIMAPFGSISSFADYGPQLGISHTHRLEGITIVNPVIYANTCAFKDIDNAKLISQFPNGDGFRVSDWESPDRNKRATLTRSFMLVGDDAFFPGTAECDVLTSSVYAIVLAATAFRNYFPSYFNPNVSPPYTFSAINNDVRIYSAASYQNINSPLYTGFKPAVFGILSSRTKSSNQNQVDWDFNLSNLYFSDIRIEGYTDVPLINIGLEQYPDNTNSTVSATGEVYGTISGLVFSNITAYSHPNTKYNWLLKNSIYASEEAYRPFNLTFKNVRINDTIITNNNKNNYFSWTQPAMVAENDPTIYGASYWGSSVVDFYFIIGDETADGLDGFAYDLSSTRYASIGNELGVSSKTIPGAYIFQTRSNYTNTGETGFPKYSVIRPGINTVADSVFNRPSYGDMGIESVLMYKLKQDTNRDIYLLKMTRPKSLPVSGTYKYDVTSNQTWSISATHTSALYREFITSAVSACKILKNEYKNIDFKGGVILLGNNPVSYEDEYFASSYVISDLSGLVSGIKAVFTSSTGQGLNLDKFYANIIWVNPFWSYNTYYNTFSSQLSAMDSNEIRFKYYQQPRESQYYNSFNSSPWPNSSGYVKIAEDLYNIFKDMSKSLTDPDTNPGININFSP